MANKKPAGTHVTNQISTTINDKTKAELTELLERLGMTEAAYLRSLIVQDIVSRKESQGESAKPKKRSR